MTTPNDIPESMPRPEPGGGFSVGAIAVVMLAISAAVIFWAGLSLGGGTTGRDADEQAAIEDFAATYRRINDKFVGESEPGERAPSTACSRPSMTRTPPTWALTSSNPPSPASMASSRASAPG